MLCSNHSLLPMCGWNGGLVVDVVIKSRMNSHYIVKTTEDPCWINIQIKARALQRGEALADHSHYHPAHQLHSLQAFEVDSRDACVEQRAPEVLLPPGCPAPASLFPLMKQRPLWLALRRAPADIFLSPPCLLKCPFCVSHWWNGDVCSLLAISICRQTHQCDDCFWVKCVPSFRRLPELVVLKHQCFSTAGCV